MTDQNEPKEDRTKYRGFASLTPERRSEIARMGGKCVPGSRRSFSRNRILAAEAGRKGGANAPNETRSFSTNPELARAAGKKGGAIKGKKRKEAREKQPQ